MNKPEIQEMLFEYMKGSERNLSQFMADVTKVHEGIKLSQADILAMLKTQNENSEKWRADIETKLNNLDAAMKPIVDLYSDSLTVRKFFSVTMGSVTKFGTFVGSCIALYWVVKKIFL